MSVTRNFFPEFLHLSPVECQNDDGSKYVVYAPVDNNGQILTKEYSFDFVEKVLAFYSEKGVDDFIKKQNDYSRLMSGSLDSFIYDEKTDLFSFPLLNCKYKPFKTERLWSCSCGWCGKKLSINIQPGYYSISRFAHERACSEDCAALIWKDSWKNWAIEKGYIKYFAI